MPKKPLATIPADLRGVNHLTLEDIERVVELRRRREALKAQRDAAAKKVETLERDIRAGVREEFEILAVETSPAETPPMSPASLE